MSRKTTVDRRKLSEIISAHRKGRRAGEDYSIWLGGPREMGPNSDVDLLVIKRGKFHRGRLTEKIYMNLFGVGQAVGVVVGDLRRR